MRMDRVFIKDSQVFHLHQVSNENVSTLQSEWTTNYIKSIKLERKMELALVDITLPKKIFNYQIENKYLKLTFYMSWTGLKDRETFKSGEIINRSDYSRRFGMFDINNPFENPTESYKEEVRFQNHYQNFEDLLKDVSEKINKECNAKAKWIFQKWMPDAFIKGHYENEDIHFQPLEFKYDYWRQKWQFKSKPGVIKLRKKGSPQYNNGVEIAKFIYNFNDKLHETLGIDNTMFPLNELSDEKEFKFNSNVIKLKIPKNYFIDKLLFVKSDILKVSYVNNSRSECMRSISFSNRIQHYSFNNYLFIPIRFEDIDSIKISIKDTDDNVFYYEEGFISLTLLVRPIEMI